MEGIRMVRGSLGKGVGVKALGVRISCLPQTWSSDPGREIRRDYPGKIGGTARIRVFGGRRHNF